MLKRVLLKSSCTIIFLIFSLRNSNSFPLEIPPPTRLPQIHKEWNNLKAQKHRASQWNINVFKDKSYETLGGGDDDETGFDLTDEEIKKFKLWPKGVVPYYIDVRSYSDKVLRDKIRLFLNVVNSLTSLNFVELPGPPKDDTTRWVFFINRRGLLGCADHSIKNFTNEGVQQVVLGYDCMSTGGELAEAVLAIAGVPPQHNSPDRDAYIKVIEENILPEKKYMYEKLKDDEWLFHDSKYDFSSAGHYHYHKYSVNGRATIDTQDKYFGTSIGETSGFSYSDIWKLRMLYNYIATKKKEMQLPECKKLFNRGINNNIQHNPYDQMIKPQKKPNKYLGLPEEIVENESVIDVSNDPSKTGSEDNNEEEDVDNNKYKDNVNGNDSDSDNGNNKGSDNNKSIDKVPDASSKITKNIPSNVQVLKQQLKTNLKRDPMLYLSDYRTGDEIYTKKIAKNVGVDYMKYANPGRIRGIKK